MCARNGRWIKGPGMDFVNAVKNHLPHVSLIAEDLGFLTQEVLDLRDASGYPGMKVLGFAFDSREPSDYLPYNYIPNTVCYTGTHDNQDSNLEKQDQNLLCYHYTIVQSFNRTTRSVFDDAKILLFYDSPNFFITFFNKKISNPTFTLKKSKNKTDFTSFFSFIRQNQVSLCFVFI